MEVYKEVKIEDNPIENEKEFDEIDKTMKEKKDIDESKCKGRE